MLSSDAFMFRRVQATEGKLIDGNDCKEADQTENGDENKKCAPNLVCDKTAEGKTEGYDGKCKAPQIEEAPPAEPKKCDKHDDCTEADKPKCDGAEGAKTCQAATKLKKGEKTACDPKSKTDVCDSGEKCLQDAADKKNKCLPEPAAPTPDDKKDDKKASCSPAKEK